MKKITNTLLFCFLAYYSFGVYARPESTNKELNQHIQIFLQKNNQQAQADVAKKLEWSGFSDPKLFDLIEKNLLTEHTASQPDKYHIEYLSWMAKALSFSGDEKYLPTLEKVLKEAKHRKLRKYTQLSIQQLPKYTQWNKIILSEDKWDYTLSNNVNRFLSMALSNDQRLIILAAKRIHYSGEYNEKLLNALEKELLNKYKTASSNLEVQALAWSCKAIAGSKKEKYKKTIETVASSAENASLRRHAKKYLKQYFRVASNSSPFQ